MIISVDNNLIQNGASARIKVSVSLESDPSAIATVTLKLINRNRWKIYDLEYQSVSILDIEKIGYDSKIKRQGLEKLIENVAFENLKSLENWNYYLKSRQCPLELLLLASLPSLQKNHLSLFAIPSEIVRLHKEEGVGKVRLSSPHHLVV